MKKFYKQKNRGRQTLSLSKGFTLVETLVAISIFTMSILGLISILASGISNTNYAKQKMTATYLAQEGIEYARNLRDIEVLSNANGWSNFNNTEDTTTIDDSSISDPVFSPTFTRTITKTQMSDDEVKINSKVGWSQGSGNYEIIFSENLFNWVE